jgi:sporulation integral membrane protein YtvI
MYCGFKKALSIAALALGTWIIVQFFLPLGFPFLLGLGLALAAEPMTGFLCSRMKLRRGIAAGIGVTAAFCLIFLLVLMVIALILREIALMVGILPNLEQSLSGGLSALSAWALAITARMPGGIRQVLEGSLRDFFSGSSALLQQAFRWALSLTGGVLRHVPGSALILGTAVISSYMISARLPRIRIWLKNRVPSQRIQKFLAWLHQLRTVLLGWLKAQAKLMGITWLILTMGLVLLRVTHAPLWAATVSLVDAFPILGTGTVLLPWALVSALQGQTVRGIGLLSIYAVISLVRSVLEPKLLGSHLGLDPLATLVALYAGFRLWGFGGMLLAPMLAVVVTQLIQEPKVQQ